jgi:hypothetical protein
MRSLGFRKSSPVAQIGSSSFSKYVASGASPFRTSS